MASRKRRIRSPHPGVYLLRRTLASGSVVWQARYVDADTGQTRKPLLDGVALPTAEARTLWAKRLSKTLAKRRMDLAAGAPVIDGKPIAEAVTSYLESGKHRLRSRTLITYRQGIDRFSAWAKKTGRPSTKELSPPRLAAFREHLIALPHQRIKAGGRRGERHETTKKRSPNAVNAELRPVKTMLNAWRLAGLLPLLSKDAIADTLRPLPTPRERPSYLAPSVVQKLLQACLRHDAERFAATRSEHAGLVPLGSTPRYDPIAPFTVFLLLSGCRVGEGLTLKWEAIDLDALDHEGRKVGEIHLKAADVKTAQARVVDLGVSPALRALLAAMKLRAGKDRFVFGGADALRYSAVEAARKRLHAEYGAPIFSWQNLRQTTASYLTNAPSVFGAASAYRSAAQLGHAVEVAQRRYVGLVRGISRDARTVEAAIQIEGELARIVQGIGGKGGRLASVARKATR